MAHKKRTVSHIMIGLSLTVSLLFGCATMPGGNAPAPTAPQPTKNYEHYQENEQKQQAEFDQMIDDLFLDEVDNSLIQLHFTLADPASYGITEYEPTFGEASLDDVRESIKEVKSLKTQLQSFDSDLLREDQLLTHRILESYVNTLLSGEGMELYDQPLSSSIGIQAQLPILLSEYKFYTRRDVDDYLALLSTIDDYYSKLLAFEQQKASEGLGPCDQVIDRIVDSCNAYMLDADHSIMAESFQQRLEGVEGLTPEESPAYIQKNKEVINAHFVPAYQQLSDGIKALKGTGSNDMGLSHYPNGQKYYEYLVRLNTGTSYPSIKALKSAIESQFADDLTAINNIIKRNPKVAGDLDNYAFRLNDPMAIIEDLRSQCSEDYPPIKNYPYSVKSVPKALEPVLSPAFYLTVPIDRVDDNSIYINHGSDQVEKTLYTTLAHEGYPGHMYQTLYFNDTGASNLRKLLSFSSYTEGWATYVEYDSYSLDNGLDPDTAQVLAHNASATLALYALLDINIHYEGWNRDQVKKLLQMSFSIDDDSVIDTVYYDVVETPSNYLLYYVGYLEILNMRKEAEKELGAQFSPLEFNKFILDIGPAPFDVIQRYFKTWLLTYNLNSGS